ncbi:hypothetical protein AA0120_g5639 [Alternaria tenuissima]|jgi:hypothetical protein|nr:hypothetical protein AA0120_g5639 [Alternaria tenuissima]
MMSRIYTRSSNVCIWLGEDDNADERAIKFIRKKITHLKDFDTISSNEIYSEDWHALMMLMQKEWFSRRWVVQEISLAKNARIHCGPYSIPWKEFAVAVELFVEVETATHRLSEVMWKDKKFLHVPGMFEYVSELGASLLVGATGKIFRTHKTPMDDDHGDDETAEDMVAWMEEVHTIDPLDRRSLLSLEYLVTTMFIFRATECRDSIYSMLAIARDAAPFADPDRSYDDVSLTMTLFDSFLAEKPFRVDYARPYSDVCRDFVEFCIQRTHAREPVQALDILCRPWALEPPQGRSIRLSPERSTRNRGQERLKPEREVPWKRLVCQVKWEPRQPEWSLEKPEWTYEKPRKIERNDWIEDDREMEEYWEENRKKEIGDVTESWTYTSWTHTLLMSHKVTWKKPEGWDKVEALVAVSAKRGPARKTSPEDIDRDLDLPSWVCRAKKAPFELYAHPGMHIKKTGRANANPLVGEPADGHRNYSAAQTKGLTLKSSEGFKFRKRPCAGHYSLYVRGFVIDAVKTVVEASQGGNIPRSWLDLGGWESPYDNDPPGELWRTLVADRGNDNRNPPNYYARACRESVSRGGIASGRVDTTALINNERNSIIAEFCRRVHAVIWGRSMFRTESGKLGIACSDVKVGDKICILYGCTVPVILSVQHKKPAQREQDEFEDHFEAFKSCYERLERIMVRKYRYNKKKSKDPMWEAQVKSSTERLKNELDLLRRYAKEDQERQRKRAITREIIRAELKGKEKVIVSEQDKEEDEQSKKKKQGTKQETDISVATRFLHLFVDMVWIIISCAIYFASRYFDLPNWAATLAPVVITTLASLSEYVPLDLKASLKHDASPDEDPDLDANRYYIFKGESYVHGFMDGEALRAKFYKEGTAEDRIFELR